MQNPEELLRLLGLTAEECGLSQSALANFPLRVPRAYVERIRPGDPRDPLLLQILPVMDETLAIDGFAADPVGDLASTRTPGLLQKYAGRALLITTGACAIHCRYCFRRGFPYAEQSAAGDQLEAALQEIASDPTLAEIILSGGDPMVISDIRLRKLLQHLDAIPHIQRIRLHTRVPVVQPERVTSELLATLQSLRTRVVVVVHANHARELDDAAVAALRALAGVTGPVLNQSVLLRNINDSVDALASLSTALFDAGVLPYYLHQLDPVAGAAHFDVPDDEALRLVGELLQRLPGYLVPRLVREVPGASSKTLLGPFASPAGYIGTT
ncbi:MAG: EF-P beta-lysylation protein EpmB [Gammaproteobacteria bacterium]